LNPEDLDLDDEDGEEDSQKVAAALIQMLDDDVERILGRFDALREEASAEDVTPDEMHEHDREWHSLTRELFRAFFAYVEGTVFSLKQYARYQLAVLGSPLEQHEADATYEGAWRMRDNGVVEWKTANIQFMPNLLFMISLQERLHGLKNQLDKNSLWFRALKESVEVRNRLMHPKHPFDLLPGVEDLKSLLMAREGFIALLEKFLGPRPWSLPDIWDTFPDVDVKEDWTKDIGLFQHMPPRAHM
jgi:hypothetical protein